MSVKGGCILLYLYYPILDGLKLVFISIFSVLIQLKHMIQIIKSNKHKKLNICFNEYLKTKANPISFFIDSRLNVFTLKICTVLRNFK